MADKMSKECKGLFFRAYMAQCNSCGPICDKDEFVAILKIEHCNEECRGCAEKTLKNLNHSILHGSLGIKIEDNDLYTVDIINYKESEFTFDITRIEG